MLRPETVDATEYEQFNYKLYDQDAMQLEDAIKKAAELRSKDNKNFYHVVPADREMTKFCVDAIPVYKAQSARFSRWLSIIMRNLAISPRRNG